MDNQSINSSFLDSGSVGNLGKAFLGKKELNEEDLSKLVHVKFRVLP